MNTRTISILFASAIVLSFPGRARPVDSPALMPPVKSVYRHYLTIQKELANDSLKGVSREAGAIAKTVATDPMKMLGSDVVKPAQKLAAAKDLKAARAAFKPLSDSLIKYLADHHVPKGSYVEVYCPMAKASWLQADKDVKNPYMGREMLSCGEVKE